MRYTDCTGYVTRWDELGLDVKGMGSEGILEAVGLNWTVDCHPIGLPNGDLSKNNYVLVRSDTGEDLDVVRGAKWFPMQNREFVEGAIALADRLEGKVSRAGSSVKRGHTGGTIVPWVLIEPPKELKDLIQFDKHPGARSDGYILCSNAHKYGHAVTAELLAVRQICSNGLAQKISVGNRVNHTRSVSNVFARITAQGLKETIEQHNAENKLLANTRITEQAAYLWFMERYGKESQEDYDKQPAKFKQLWRIYTGEAEFDIPGIELGQNVGPTFESLYGMLQAVTAYENHFGRGLEANLVSIVREERHAAMQAVQKTLLEATKRRQSGTQQVVIRAF